MVKTKPPAKPSMVFLGETLGKSLFFPMFFPTKYAKVSLVQIKTIIEIKIFVFYPFTPIAI